MRSLLLVSLMIFFDGAINAQKQPVTPPIQQPVKINTKIKNLPNDALLLWSEPAGRFRLTLK